MKNDFCVYLVFIVLNLPFNSAMAAGDKSGETGGLPQLDITTWPTQLFWLIITFGLGYIIISKLVIPSISSVLDERSNKISSNLNKAKDAQEEAKTALSLYEASLNDARTKAATSAAKALDDAKLETAKRDAALSKKLAASAKKAEEKLSEIKNETLSSLDDLATEISQKIISDLTPIKVSKSVVKKHVSVQSKLQN